MPANIWLTKYYAVSSYLLIHFFKRQSFKDDHSEAMCLDTLSHLQHI